MEIPKTLLKKWQVLRSAEDANKIATAADCTPQAVRDAFKNCKASDKLFNEMAKLYQDKAELIKKYL